MRIKVSTKIERYNPEDGRFYYYPEDFYFNYNNNGENK